MTRYEARKLRHGMQRELEGKPATLWICAVGLAVVVALGLFASVDVTQHEMAGTATLARAGHAVR